MPARDTGKDQTPLYKWRLARDITQQAAAELFGVSFSTYRRLELMAKLPKRYDLAFKALKQKPPA